MSSNIRTLGEACVAVVDCEHKTAPIDPDGDAWAVGTPALVDGRIDFAQARRISDDTYLEWTRRLVPREDDLILAREAPVGPVGLVPAGVRVALGQRTVLLRPDPRVVVSRYLHALMGSPRMQRALASKAEGSTVVHLNVPDVRGLPLPPLPPLAEQRAIADILGALGDKIESNRRVVAAARTLAITSLSDVAVVGAIVRVRDIAEVRKGLSYKGSGLLPGNASLPMVNLGNFGRDGWLNRTALKPYSGDYQERHLVHGGDLVVANTDLTQQRAILGRPALIPHDLTLALFTHHVYAVHAKEPSLTVGIWAALNGDAFRERAEGFATGTTVAGLPRDALMDFGFQVPSAAALRTATAILRIAWAAEVESQTLAAFRDALVPELLSGRLRTPAAREQLEAMV